jgi:hypothetical protein
MPDIWTENREKMWQGFAAGTIATFLMTALVVTVPAFGAPVPEVAMRLLRTMRQHPSWLACTLVFHFGYGSLAGALFAIGARHMSVSAGLSFGLLLWTIAIVVYAPLVGLGFAAGKQPALALFALPVHALYGCALGALGPRGAIVQPINDLRAAHR